MSIGLSRTTASPRPSSSKATSFVRAVKAQGEHVTPSLAKAPGQGASHQVLDLAVTNNMDEADLQNLSTSLQRVLEISTDGGQSWRAIASVTYNPAEGIHDGPLTFNYKATCPPGALPANTQYRAKIVNLNSAACTTDCIVEARH